MKIKYCGITTIKEIHAINKINPDYIGFVFAKSKRRVSVETAIRLKSYLNKNILVVGVFVDEDIATILELVKLNLIDFIQLHGVESIKTIKKIKKMSGLKIIKAIALETEFDKELLKCDEIDFLLFDASKPGSNKSFNHKMIPQVSKPYFIAGGLNANNVNEVVNYNPYGVDVSSGIESNGKKDLVKMKKFKRSVINGKRKI